MNPYDLYLSARATADLAVLDVRELGDFERAKDLLLVDPTDANPLVARVDDPRFPGSFMLVWGNVLVIYSFVNEFVIEILAVGRRQSPR